ELEEAQAKIDLDRNQKFFEQGHLTEKELQESRTTWLLDTVAVASARAAIRRAQYNLDNAILHSPINGTVISRDVEEGQTVAASLSSPTLFVIAENLAQMQILASVDESDIGMIKTGQQVRFTVQAYPDTIYQGQVKQVRLEPTTTSNIVNYTVVIDAPNPEGKLLPGMTATVDFIIAQSDSGFLATNSALSFSPPDFPKMTDTSKHVLWVLSDNAPMPIPVQVRTGLSDGAHTWVASQKLKDGMELVTGVVENSASKTTTRSLFGPPQRKKGDKGGPPPM
ncbi:MAG TPA: efflux RND transporter periplasmic adaptor subunit, partial [Fibrobacteraceae bacterium]|nr:efflux RND transporter periplasmic adaptor subunit [Fibrobacteraceae bacterium]